MNTSSAHPTLYHSQHRLSVQAVRQSMAGQEYVANEVLLAVDKTVSTTDLSSEMGLSVLKQRDGFVRAKIAPGTDLAEKIAELRATPGVRAADLNALIERGEMSDALPNDLTEDLWGLHNSGQKDGTAGADIKAVSAWKEVTGTREGAVIAVIDTGVDITPISPPTSGPTLMRSPGTASTMTATVWSTTSTATTPPTTTLM